MKCGAVPVSVRSTIVRCTLAFLAPLVVVVVGLTGRASGRQAGPVAREAGRVNLLESAQLKLAGEQGETLIEHGYATGTYDAPVTVRFTLHPRSVTAVVTIFPHGGSIEGVAQANYVVKGSVGYFGGSLALGRGTGSYSHISEIGGKALGVSGTINRYSFALTVKAHGEVNL